MTTATRIDEVVDELIDLIGAATGLQVLDGATVDEPMRECIAVGVAESGPGYRSRVALEDGMAPSRWREDWTVWCTLALLTGDVAPGRQRRRAREALDKIDQAVSDNRERSGVWEFAGLEGDRSFGLVNTPDGTLLVVTFPVVGVCLL